MKSTQLRIGNWYNEYGIPKQATPEIISNLYTIEQNGKTAIDFDFLPLTEEWLLKCTNYTKWKYFGEHYGGYFDLFGNWKLMLRYFNGEFTFLIVTVNREKDFFKSVKEINIDINYVHQLQNFIFANRSKELEFKL